MREPMVVPCPLWRAAEQSPEAVALITPSHTYSYGELNQHIEDLAALLKAHEIKKGTPVGVYVNDKATALMALLAIIRAEGVVAPLSTRESLSSYNPLLHLNIVDCDEGIGENNTISLPRISMSSPNRPYSFSEAYWHINNAATIIRTSGSTGYPKRALHTLGNHYFSAIGANQNMPIECGDRWLLSLPMHHVGGLAIIFRILLAGATLVVPDSNATLAENLKRFSITHASLVATQLQRILSQFSDSLVAMKAILLGGSAIPASLLDAACERGLPIHTTYGLTEMASQVSTTPINATRDTLSSSGYVLPYRDVEISSQGEILVRGSTLFAGYLDEDGTVALPVNADGWFATRDLGYFDEHGRLHVEGRIDNMFISGGENIYPEEIERALCTIEEVIQAVVIPIADAQYGQRPVAFVQTRDNSFSSAYFRQKLGEVLPSFKIPDAFYDWPEAQEASMKVDRDLFLRHALVQ